MSRRLSCRYLENCFPRMVNKALYNTVLCMTFSTCGNYLIIGDIYGQISVYNLNKLMNPDPTLTKPDHNPRNKFTIQEDVQINSVLTTENFLLVGVCEISAYDWNVVMNHKDAKVSWKIVLPNNKDAFEKPEVNCMVLNKDGRMVYAGCGDNNVYIIDLEIGAIVRTLSGHSDYIHSVYNIGNDLASGGEDGLVNIWDLRSRKVTYKLEPFKNDDIARPELGKWIGAVCLNEDWMLCGGGPKLSLWHFRSMTPSTIFPMEDRGIHIAELLDDKLLAGGRCEYFYTLAFNGDIISQIATSCVTVYAAAHQQVPYKALCFAGSGSKIDICSNFSYKDQVLPLL